MNRSAKVLLALVGTVLVLAVAALVADRMMMFQMGESVVSRFTFVALGLLIVFAIYYATREHRMWEVGTREVVYMAIGAALYAVLSYIFNGTVFAVPSVSQVALRPAIAIPMFFGYAFGPVVGFFTGAVGNVFGDALTGFSVSPQWSIGNGLVGLISGLVWLFSDKRRSLNTLLIVSGAIAAVALVLWLLNPTLQNQMYFEAEEPVSMFAGLTILIGFLLVLAVRFAFRSNIDLAAAVTWAMLGNLVGIGFAALSDIVINGYSPQVAIVGEFLPAAGPNLLFAAILVPLLVLAYNSVQRQTGR